MLPIVIQNGVAALNINKLRKLSPRQLSTLARTKDWYGEQAGTTYLMSLLGLTKGRVNVYRHRVDQRADSLSTKPAGRYRQMFERLLDNGDERNHKPTTKDVGRWIGVEIECYYPVDKECTDDCDHDNGDCYAKSDVSDETIRGRLRKLLREANVTRCSVKYDGSLHSENGIGVEVTILFNTANDFEPLRKVCRVLNDAGCFVDKTCGLHVHLDARHLKPGGVKLIGRRFARALPVLQYLVDDTRHNNHYCKLAVSPFSREHDDRYYAVNLTAFYRYRTVEVRLHGGSTNFNKIKNWVELLQFVATRRAMKPLKTFQDFIDSGVPEHLVEYADKRIRRLHPQVWETVLNPPSPAAVASQPPVTAVG